MSRLDYAIKIWFARMVIGFALTGAYLAAWRGDTLAVAAEDSIADEWLSILARLIVNRRIDHGR